MVMKMGIPAYTQSDTILGDYDSISHTPRFIIYNVSNGPGSGGAITAVTESMTDNHANSGKNYVYVDTNDQANSKASVETNIDTWVTDYGSLIDGIYFDNVKRPTATSWTNYYDALGVYVSTLVGTAANPVCMWGVGADGSNAAVVTSSYAANGNYVLLHEVSQSTGTTNYPSSSNVPSWLTSAIAPRMLSCLLKGSSTPALADGEAFADACKANNIYNCFATDQTTYSIESGLLAGMNTYLATI